ncbi:MAG: hypothetical protein LC126_00935, partial [Bryobacterales bacterium]|nr:hypothetical protein [Bryobacterales bacterium]
MMHRILSLLVVGALCGGAQEWHSYAGRPGGQKYSRLKQIDRTNVGRLKAAWTFHTGDVSDGKEFPVRSAFEA